MRTLRALTAGLLLAPLLVTLGVTAAVAQEASPAASPSASTAPPVEVTEADSGRTVRLVPGQELQVELTAPSEGEQWQGPATSGPLYLLRYSEGAARTTARLQALRASAEPVVLRAKTDRKCFHDGTPCPQAFSEWSLSVIVDEGPQVEPDERCMPRAVASPAPGAIVVTSSGRVQVPVGKTFTVQLGNCDATWSVSSYDGPIFRSSAFSRVGGLDETFRAVATGTATIASQTDPACAHTSPACPEAPRQFSVEVEVVPAVADDSCMVPTAIELDDDTIVATGETGLTVRTAPDVLLDLYAYTRPSTAYRLVRSVVAGGDGVARFTVRPPANTRLYAQKRGCQPGPSTVLNVRTALTLTATRTGPREYVFAGDSLPDRQPLPPDRRRPAGADGPGARRRRRRGLASCAALHRKWSLRLRRAHRPGSAERAGQQQRQVDAHLLTRRFGAGAAGHALSRDEEDRMWWSTLTGKLEQAKVLDPVAGGVNAVVHKVLPRGPVKDALHGTWLGHSVHPLLVAVPIGMWSGALLLDLTAGKAGHDAARRLVGAGVLAVLPTAATGLADWSELGVAKKPKRVGLVHATANVATTVVYGLSWLARRQGDHARGRRLALLGAGGLAVGGYLGGHLSYSQAVGVNRNAGEATKPRTWTDAGAAADLPERQPKRVDVDGQQIVLVRQDGQLHAMSATCSHWSGPMEEGELVTSGDDKCLECPWHGSRFRLVDGSVARGPATTSQLSYDVRATGDRLQVRVRA